MTKLLVASLSVLLLATAQSCGSPVGAQSVGPQGPPGPAGVSGYEVVKLTQSLLPNGATPLVLTCPSGKAAIAAGFITGNSNIPIMDSHPGSTKSDWNFLIRNSSGAAADVSVYAVCVIAN